MKNQPPVSWGLPSVIISLVLNGDRFTRPLWKPRAFGTPLDHGMFPRPVPPPAAGSAGRAPPLLWCQSPCAATVGRSPWPRLGPSRCHRESPPLLELSAENRLGFWEFIAAPQQVRKIEKSSVSRTVASYVSIFLGLAIRDEMTGNHGILDFVAFFYAKRYCGGPFSFNQVWKWWSRWSKWDSCRKLGA